jgi:hypothetical protein
VYDMYYWDQPQPPGPPGPPGQAMLTGARHRGRPAGGARQPRPPAPGIPRPRLPADRTAHRGPANPAGPAAQAVQVALDRRDNGGDSGAPRDQ